MTGNEPIYGCDTCNTTLGRSGCFYHQDKLPTKYAIGPMHDAYMGEIDNLKAKLAVAERRIKELEEAPLNLPAAEIKKRLADAEEGLRRERELADRLAAELRWRVALTGVPNDALADHAEARKVAP